MGSVAVRRCAGLPHSGGDILLEKGNGEGYKRGEERLVSRETEKLMAVQETDRAIRRLKKAEAEAPERRAAAEGLVRAAEGALKAAEGKKREAESAAKRAEGDVEARRALAEKYRADQLKVKTNEGYRALENQIAQALAEASAYEDEVLEAMGRADEASGEVAAMREALATAQAECRARLEAEDRAAAERAAELSGLSAERAERAARVEPGLLGRYERILAKWGDCGVAGVEHGACGGCHMTLSPATLVEARKEGVVATCGFCGRILHGGADGKGGGDDF